MRSELVNYLEISTPSKILLRACIELQKKFRVVLDDNNQVFLNYVFPATKLTFGQGLEAMEELEKLQLIEWRVSAKDLPTIRYSNLWKFIKTTMEDMEVNRLGSVPTIDYKEICSLIEQKEADGFSTVSPVKQIVAS